MMMILPPHLVVTAQMKKNRHLYQIQMILLPLHLAVAVKSLLAM